MGVGALRSYGRFVGRVAGAACVGGILAAAAECVIGAVAGRGAFWGQPRFLYQLIFGAEVLWAAALSGLVFAAGGSIYYLAKAKWERARLDSPPLLAVVVALASASFLYFLTTGNFAMFCSMPATLVAAIYLLAAAVWFVVGGAVYLLANKLRRRFFAAQALPTHVLRVMAIGLFVPFVAAEGWAMWRARTPSPRRPDIYLVVMDAFRADRLSYYDAPRYLAPTLEMFGVDATVFGEAYTVSSWTKPAVASLFTATYPGTHGVTASFYPIPEEADTLAETLREGGYRTISVSANPNVTRPSRMVDGFDVADDTSHGPVFNAAGPPVSCMRPFIAFEGLRGLLGPLFIRSIDGVNVNARVGFWARFAGDRPTFFYVHYMEPHIPNLPRPEYAYDYQPYLARVGPDRLMRIASGPYFWHEVLKNPSYVPEFDRNEVALAKALYDADIRRMDVVIEGLLENVVARPGRDAGSVIVITADHGEEFLEHGRWLHGAGMHHEVARVPLLVKAPGCAAGVVEGPVNLVDIPPTLASLAGVERPEGWEGMDLTPHIMTGSPVPQRELLLEGTHTILMPSEGEGDGCTIELTGMVAGGYYYLEDENAETEYLYEEPGDRWQRNNLAGEEAGVLAGSRAATARAKRRVEKKAFGQEEIRLTPSLEGQLKALGYIK